MDYINIVELITESELDAALSGAHAATTHRSAAARPGKPKTRAEQKASAAIRCVARKTSLFHDLFMFDDAALLRLTHSRPGANEYEFHLADRLITAQTKIARLEAELCDALEDIAALLRGRGQ